MAEYWEVVYRAVADFGDLMAKAAAAKTALKDLQAAAKAESDEETRGQEAATAARKADSAAIKQEIADLAALKAAAAAANQQVAFGGRSSMDQHLQDLDRELNYENLLNRAKWMNFSSPQQAYAFQQQQLQLKKLMNYAEWAGYTTPDQYLGYLDRQRAALTAGNSVLLARAEAYRQLADAALSYNNALHGTNKTLGEIGESGSVGNLAAELSGLPSEVRIKLDVDDTEALARVAADRAALSAIPRVITTTEVTENGLPNNYRSDQALDFGSQLAQLAAMRSASPGPTAAEDYQLNRILQSWRQSLVSRYQGVNWNFQEAPGMSGISGGGGGGPPLPPPLTPMGDDGDDWEAKLLGITEGLEKARQAEQAFKAVGPPAPEDLGAWNVMASGVEDTASAFEDAKSGADDLGDTLHGTVYDGANRFLEELQDLMARLREFGTADAEVAGLLQNTMAHLQGLNVNSSDDISRVAYALGNLGKIDPENLSKFSDNAKGVILNIIDLIGKSSNLKTIAQQAYGALGLYKIGLDNLGQSAERLTTSGLVDLSKGFYQASESADEASAVITEAGHNFLGWSSRFELWGGKFGENHFAGAIAGWHLWLDAIVEFGATAIPALAAGVIGLGAFGIAVATAGNTTSAMVHHLEAMYTVSKATDSALGPFNRSLDATKSSLSTANQAATPLAGSMDMLQTKTEAANDKLGPFATSMDQLQSKSKATTASLTTTAHATETLQQSIQPKAWELVGDVMLVLAHNTGTFGVIANRVGGYLDTLAAKITSNLVNGSGKGLINFFNLGAADVHRFGVVLGSVGSIFGSLIKASQETQVAERLLTLLGDAAKFAAEAISLIPTPLLATLIGIHSFLVYGGLFTTWVQRAALGIAGLAARIPAFSDSMISFGQAIGASTAQLETMATKSGALNTIAEQLGTTSLEAARMQAYIASTGQTMEEFASQTNAGRQLIAEYGAGLDETGRQAVITGVALGGTEEQIAKIAAAQNTTPIMGLAKAFGISAQGAEQLAEQVDQAGFSMESLIGKVPNGTDLFEKYGSGLKEAGQNAVGLGIVLGGTEEQIESIAKDAQAAEGDTSLFSKAMSGLGGFLAGNWVTIALGAAVGFGVIAAKALSASSGVSKFVGNLQSGLAAMSGAQAFVSIPDNLGKIEAQINATNKAWSNEVGFFGSKGALNNWDSFWVRWKTGFDNAVHDLGFTGNANPDLSALQGQLNSELKTYGNLSMTLEGLTKQGYNFTQSLGVISAAGVSTGDSLQVMQTKVQGLLAGYKLAGQSAGAVGEDVDVLTVNASSAVTQMGNLNQAFDTWTSNVAGPVNSFLTLSQSVQQYGTDAEAAGAKSTGLGTAVAGMEGNISSSASTLEQDFQTVFSNVESLFDTVRTSEAIAGGSSKTFTDTVKDSVAALVPLAGTNKAAAAEISALAQEAGGPATTNLQQLAKWAGNVKDPMDKLQGITNQAAIATSNLSQDAAQLTTTIQQELIPQMAASIIAASKSGPAMQGFATAVFSGHDSIKQLLPSAETLFNTLLKVSGNTSNAKSLFIGFAESMGLSKDKATALYSQINQNEIKPKVDVTEADNKLNQMYQHMKQASTPPPPGGWDGFWQQVSMDFTSWIWHPLDTFFNHTLESWYNNSNNALSLAWQESKEAFDNYFSNPINKFFNTDIESWYRVAVNSGHVMWSEFANYFQVEVSNSVEHFFTSDITTFFHSGYENFLKDFGDPLVKWFSSSLPAGLEAGLNWSIDHVINKFIGIVNHDLLGWIPGGLSIPSFQHVASGGHIFGSVPGTGDEDGTTIVAMGGEYMLRKPARMALQARYGPNFLPTLNQADTWLGSGSRGNMASQQSPASGRYAGGGIIGDIEGAIGGGASWLEGFAGWSASELSNIPGISSLMNLAKSGLGSLVNGAWTHLVDPVIDLVQNPYARDMADMTSTALKDGIDKLMDQKQAAATANVSAGLGSGNVRAEQLYALSQFPGYGWNSGQLPPLVSLWDKESGWNANAVNPDSGAYGIPQALGKGHPYNLGDWRSQINWGLQYIAGRYGDPSNAWAHEVANNWYAGGGPVVSAILDRTGTTKIREAMALGSWLESKWVDTATTSRLTEYGPYQIDLRKHTGVTKTDAESPVWSTNWAYPYYERAANQVAAGLWKANPKSAAEDAARIAQTAFGTSFTSPSAGTLTSGWEEVLGVLGIAPAAAVSPTSGANNVQKFNYYSGLATKQWSTAFNDWSSLYNRQKAGKSVSALENASSTDLKNAAKYALEAEQAHDRKNPVLEAQYKKLALAATRDAAEEKAELSDWETWVADKLVIAAGEKQTQAAWSALKANFGSPASMTNAQWETLRSDLDFWHGTVGGNTPPKADWGAERSVSWPTGYKAGSIVPSATYAKQNFNGIRTSAYNAIGALQGGVGDAYTAWHAQWGDVLTKGGGTPGITVQNPGNTSPVSVNLSSLEYGGPSGGGNAGPGGYGFAAGGPIDVAAMFAAGGAVPTPNFVMPGISASFQKQLAGAAEQQLPRSLSDAAGEQVGLKVGQLTINNPVSEQPSQSIARAGNRLAFLAGRGAF